MDAATINDVDQSLKSLYGDEVKYFMFGSRVPFIAHGRNHRDYSNFLLSNNLDYDIIIFRDSPELACNSSGLNFAVKDTYADVQYIHNTDYNDIRMLELHSYQFLPDSIRCRLTNITDFDWSYTKSDIRSIISQKAAHSLVKATKKYCIENDTIASYKSLYHSFRIFNYGQQVGEYGYIKDFLDGKMIAVIRTLDVLYKHDDWSYIRGIIKPLFNKEHSKFKKYFPKE